MYVYVYVYAYVHGYMRECVHVCVCVYVCVVCKGGAVFMHYNAHNGYAIFSNTQSCIHTYIHTCINA